MTSYDFNNPAKSTGTFAFTLRDVLAVGFRHKRLLMLCFGGVLLGTVLTILLMPPEYMARTQILVKHERVDPVITSQQSMPVQARDEVSEEQLNSEVAIIESEDVLRQTVVSCGLQNRKSFSGWLFGRTEDERIAKAVERLQSNLKVEPVRKSDLISISYTSSNPKLAAKVLQTLANGYIQKHLEVHRPPGHSTAWR